MVAERGPGWGLAPCLVALVDECDARAPNRSTISDGSIGDPAHAARTSDHNPADGWVCAVDVTDDKANGCDADLLAQHIVASRDPRVKYVIWNRTICKSYQDKAGTPAWTPQPYTGVNAHEKHTHVSVHNTPAARGDTGPWWPDEEDDMQEQDWNRLMEIVANVVDRKVDAAVADIKGNADTLRDSLSALQRRVLGVDLMANSEEQHRADADTGARFQKLLGGA